MSGREESELGKRGEEPEHELAAVHDVPKYNDGSASLGPGTRHPVRTTQAHGKTGWRRRISMSFPGTTPAAGFAPATQPRNEQAIHRVRKGWMPAR